MSKPLFQSKFRINEILDWTLHNTSIREALSSLTYTRWCDREPSISREFKDSWTAELNVNFISGTIVVSLYPEGENEQA